MNDLISSEKIPLSPERIKPSGVKQALSRVFFPDWAYRMIRLILGGIFLWSGTTKITTPFFIDQ
jgi:hypothetical protein